VVGWLVGCHSKSKEKSAHGGLTSAKSQAPCSRRYRPPIHCLNSQQLRVSSFCSCIDPQDRRASIQPASSTWNTTNQRLQPPQFLIHYYLLVTPYLADTSHPLEQYSETLHVLRHETRRPQHRRAPRQAQRLLQQPRTALPLRHVVPIHRD
jgi:hypothetical protein